MFSFGVLPSMNRAGGGATMRTRFCENYFLGRKKISQNLGSDFPARRRGLGRNARGSAFGFLARAAINNKKKAPGGEPLGLVVS